MAANGVTLPLLLQCPALGLYCQLYGHFLWGHHGQCYACFVSSVMWIDTANDDDDDDDCCCTGSRLADQDEYDGQGTGYMEMQPGSITPPTQGNSVYIDMTPLTHKGK